jgi:SPP1 family predicted phage head-tail adaptor
MIGELDRRITISEATVLQSATGEPVRTWAVTRTCWANVEYSGGSETIITDTPTVKADKFFTIRYTTAISEKSRIIYDGKAYNVTHIEEIDRKRYLKVTASIPDNE